MKFITSEELASSKNDFLLLDIRDADTYSDGHIENSLQIDVYMDLKFGNTKNAKEKFSHLPKNKTIITICNAGITAQKASSLLEEMGYKTKVLEGGMMAWSENHAVKSG
ncbi:MAG TPA: rhodanese-like domain-containing protein [Candidatus Nanoarchaeia archaeon]|nr:rhodanese-like domain-containing protein [Candidatus Nanoarchaeia archaeon]